MRKAHSRAGIALAAAAVMFAGACGGSSGGGDGDKNDNTGDSGATVIWGSTDKPVSYDPARRTTCRAGT